MKQLISIGLIEKDHTEQINGITANFMRLSNVTVRIGNQFGDTLSESRKAFMDSHLAQIYASYEATVKQHPHQSETSPYGDVITGIVHLTDEDAAALAKLVAQFLIGHDTASETTHPWEIAMIAYRLGGDIYDYSSNQQTIRTDSGSICWFSQNHRQWHLTLS